MTIYDFTYAANCDSASSVRSQQSQGFARGNSDDTWSRFSDTIPPRFFPSNGNLTAHGIVSRTPSNSSQSPRLYTPRSIPSTPSSTSSHPLTASATSPINVAYSPGSPLPLRIYSNPRPPTPFPRSPAVTEAADLSPLSFPGNLQFPSVSSPSATPRARYPSSVGRSSQSRSYTPTGITETTPLNNYTPTTAYDSHTLRGLPHVPGESFNDRLPPIHMSPSIPPAQSGQVRGLVNGSPSSSISTADTVIGPVQTVRRSSSTALLRKVTDRLSQSRPRHVSTTGRSAGRPSMSFSNAPAVPEIPADFTFSSHPVRENTPSFDNSNDSAYSPGPNHRSNPRRLAVALPRPEDLTPAANLHREVIQFSVRGSPGVRIKDLLKFNPVFVDDGDVGMFSNHRWSATLFAIHWPGYPESSRPIELKAKETFDRTPVSRQSLAIDIAHKIEDFMGPHLQQYTARRGSTDDKWRIARQDGHKLGDVTLVSLYLYKRVWVPEIYVVW